MSLIKLDRVTKVYGSKPQDALSFIRDGVTPSELRNRMGLTVALAEASLVVKTGEVFAVMGLSGSGKSTLLRLINRLIRPTSGTVLLDGLDIGELSNAGLRDLRRSRIAMVFQGFGLLPHFTVQDNIAFGLDIKGWERDQIRVTVSEWIKRVGLDGFANALPHELSGGMRQRVGLARALATDADILLMDEPFSGLDPLIRREMQDLLLSLEADLRRTIVFVTHDLNEAIKLGNQIAILRDGQIVQIGSGEDIMDQPANSFVRAFTEDMRLNSGYRAPVDIETEK